VPDREKIRRTLRTEKANDGDKVAGAAPGMACVMSHFPYVLFLEGSNFLTETISIKRPDGRVVKLEYNSGMLNRLDRLTSANYGMPINTNLCENKFVKHNDKTIMLQATSIYTQGNGEKWDVKEMFGIMVEISKTSLRVLGSEIFNQITKSR